MVPNVEKYVLLAGNHYLLQGVRVCLPRME